jgi:hypothetical protein
MSVHVTRLDADGAVAHDSLAELLPQLLRRGSRRSRTWRPPTVDNQLGADVRRPVSGDLAYLGQQRQAQDACRPSPDEHVTIKERLAWRGARPSPSSTEEFAKPHHGL